MGADAVTVREITKDTVHDILKLQVSEAQKAFVAANSVSLAEALFHPGDAWFRAIYAGDEPVGFAMFALESQRPLAYLWRFMVDHRRQGRGHGRRGLELLVDEMRERGYEGVALSFVEAEGGPEGFYAGLGFERTGRIVEGETEMLLRFEDR